MNISEYICIYIIYLTLIYINKIKIAERKLQPDETPHTLYVQNYSTASSTCLTIRKWLFSIRLELEIPTNDPACLYIYYQVMILEFV